ncbi:MAG: hypothetical protein Q9198_003885 [Flavoplaca austrocitrina]
MFYSIVVVDEESQVVRLVHYTTQEYFDGHPLRPLPVAQGRITKTSLHWGKHARGVPEDDYHAQILELITKEIIRAITVELSDYSDPMWTLGGLAYAAAFGLTSIVNHLLRQGEDVNQTSQMGITALMSAAKAGYIDTVRALLAAGADVNKADEEGTTALISAAGAGYVDTVMALLAVDADVNKADKWDTTALVSAAGAGYVGTVRALLAAGADVNKVNKEGTTALVSAAGAGYVDTVRALLAAGAQPDLDNCDTSALMTAASDGHDEVVQILLDHEANIEAATGLGDTSLLKATSKGFTSTVQLLVDKGANLNAQEGLLDAAIRSRSTAMVELAVNNIMKADHMENPLVYMLVRLPEGGGPTAAIFELLIEKGADPTGTINGETPICVAARYGNVEAVRSLFKHGVSPNTRDEDGNTPIHGAAFSGHHEMIETLVDHGADLTAQNDAGESGLHVFLRSEHCGRFHHLVPLLVWRDVPVSTPDAEGKTALHIAAHRGLDSTVEFLMEHGADGSRKDYGGRTPLETAAFSGNEELVEQMLKHLAIPCPPHLTRLLAGARLRNAVKGNDTVLIQEILKDPDVDVTIPEVFGRTALHFAAFRKQRKIVESLLKRGALVNARTDPDKMRYLREITGDDIWTTPLHTAAGRGCTDIVELLLKHDADLHATDDHGYKAFFTAAERGHANVIKVLLGHGSDVSESPEGRATPLQASVDYFHEDVVRLLLENGADAERDTDWGKKVLGAAKSRKREEYMHGKLHGKRATSREIAGVVELLKKYGFTTPEE